MKKIPLPLKILAPVFALIAAAGVFFGIRLMNVGKDLDAKNAETDAIEAIAPAQERISYTVSKQASEFESQETETYDGEDVFASYQYKNVTFISYSEAWDADNLESLCDELLLNTHGSEMDYLEQVLVYGPEDEEILGLHESNYGSLEIPVSHYSMLPSGFTYGLPNMTSVLSLHNGDTFTTPEQMAETLAHEYGHHFTFHYFTIRGDEEGILDDPYFNARYIDSLGIRYKDEDREDWDEYLENHMWYLVEIAAEDYVYLMGSPNAKRTMKYYDTLDQLKMYVKKQRTKLNEYYDLMVEDSFNRMPHENIAIPLPDQAEGVAELFFGAIGKEAPEYIDRSEEAEEMEIKISKRSSHGHSYYKIAWDKPWTSEDVTYTLVAYDENDEFQGAIKSITGKQSASASIGSVVYETQNYYHWYDSDWWTDQDFLRFRIVVTFSDGTAVVSPPMDKEF